MDRSVVSEYLKIDVQYTGGLLIRYWMGYEQKEIPYVRKKREVGKSGFGFLRKIGIAMELIVSNSIILLRKAISTGSYICHCRWGIKYYFSDQRSGIRVDPIIYVAYDGNIVDRKLHPGRISLAEIMSFLKEDRVICWMK